MRSVVVPVLTALVLAGTSACSAFSDGQETADGDGVRVATGFYPLQFVAERVGGDLVSVENLTVPGQEPHDLELTIKETAALAEADLVLFDPQTVRECEPEMVNDLPGNEKRLIQRAIGVKTTMVNGQILVQEGEHTGAFPGRVLGNRNGHASI